MAVLCILPQSGVALVLGVEVPFDDGQCITLERFDCLEATDEVRKGVAVGLYNYPEHFICILTLECAKFQLALHHQLNNMYSVK